MGLRGRLNKLRTPSATSPLSSVPAGLEPVWLPGGVEVQVVGESFHADAIRVAQRGAPEGGPLVAELVPEQDNPHDQNAVAVYVQHKLVGHLPRAVAALVQQALRAFAAAHGGRRVSCPAQITFHDVGPQVLLLLDPGPLGVPASAFEAVPDLDATLRSLLPKLGDPVPPMTGADTQARAALATAQQAWADAEADFDRGRGELRGVEDDFRAAARRLERARDPLTSDAWLGAARATRYQPGRRDETLEAFIEALRWHRANADAWADLLDYASAAPDIPTLVALFARAPLEVRPRLLRRLLSMSRGRDRLGRLSPRAGERLRAELLKLASSQGDTVSTRRLSRET
jgi:hypothetical protein